MNASNLNNPSDDSTQLVELLTKIESNTAVTRIWMTRFGALLVAVFLGLVVVMFAQVASQLFYR